MRTKLAATKSKSCSAAKRRSSRSLSVSEGRCMETSGMLILLWLESGPPLRTTQTMSRPQISFTSSSMRPSSMRTRLPGSSSAWRFSYVTETMLELPSTSRVVSVNSCPSLRVTGPSVKVRMRISGPFVSRMVARGTPSSSLTCLSFMSVARWLSWLPWEKLKRAASMPAPISARSLASSSTAGPMVQIIFVFLKEHPSP